MWRRSSWLPPWHHCDCLPHRCPQRQAVSSDVAIQLLSSFFVFAVTGRPTLLQFALNFWASSRNHRSGMFGRHQPRATIIKLTAIGGLLSFITLIYFSSNPSYRSRLSSSLFSERKRASCPPQAWSNGSWQYKPHNISHPLTRQEDVFEFSDLEGCTSDREFYWHLGVDHDDQYERFPDVMDYEWVPSEECTGVRRMDAGMFVRDLVQEGGWLVLGGACFYRVWFSIFSLP